MPQVLIKDLKVGDVWLTGSGYRMQILRIGERNETHVDLYCKWVGGGTPTFLDANGCYTYVMHLNSPRTLIQKKQRDCAPCYDSDCDCVFD